MTNRNFKGFPKQARVFFEELMSNNDRIWFQEHKQDFIDYVQTPAEIFVELMGDRLQTISKGLQAIPRTSGGSIMRIYRDIRFSKDKTPYKTHLGIVFWEGHGKKTDNPGFYFHLEASGADLYNGLNLYPKPLLNAFREAVIDDESGANLETILVELRDTGIYEIGGDKYKRVPKGFDPEHKRAGLLLYKSLWLKSPSIKWEQISSSTIIETCFHHFQQMAPFHHWLVSVNQRTQG
jgi:uncharacterized protein (TIGR02453 family)